MYQSPSFFLWRIAFLIYRMFHPKNGFQILHPYFPLTASSVKRALSYVPKVAVVESSDCITCISLCTSCFLSRDLIGSYKLLQCSRFDTSFTGTCHGRKGRKDQRFVGTVLRIVVSSREFFLHYFLYVVLTFCPI